MFVWLSNLDLFDNKDRCTQHLAGNILDALCYATLGLGMKSRLSIALNPIKYSGQFPSRAGSQNARHLTVDYNKNL